MHPDRPRRAALGCTFPEYLDHKLEQARWRHDALVKLNRLYELHAQSILMEEEMRRLEHFAKLTFDAPEIDRDDPLNLLGAADTPRPANPAPDPHQS